MTQVIGVLNFYKFYLMYCVSSTTFYGYDINVYSNRVKFEINRRNFHIHYDTTRVGIITHIAKYCSLALTFLPVWLKIVTIFFSVSRQTIN